MTTSAAAKEADAKSGHVDVGAIIFELEGIAASGRQATYDILRKELASHDVKLTPVQYSRYCIQPRADFYAEDLIEKTGAKKINANDLAESVKSHVGEYLASDKTSLSGGLAKLIDAALKQGYEAAAISSLPEETAERIMAHLGLTEKGVRLFTFSEIESNFPRADAWLKVARQLGKSPRLCVVVADHMAACKSALAAGMKCMAVPTGFTAHQDYCGADLVLDSWDEMSAKEILDAVSTR